NHLHSNRMNRPPTRDSPLFVHLWSVCGCARAANRLRLDRAGGECIAFSRYDLMVLIALDILKINMQGGLLINEGQKVKSSIAVLAYDFAHLVRVGGIIEALNNLFAVWA